MRVRRLRKRRRDCCVRKIDLPWRECLIILLLDFDWLDFGLTALFGYPWRLSVGCRRDLSFELDNPSESCCVCNWRHACQSWWMTRSCSGIHMFQPVRPLLQRDLSSSSAETRSQRTVVLLLASVTLHLPSCMTAPRSEHHLPLKVNFFLRPS